MITASLQYKVERLGDYYSGGVIRVRLQQAAPLYKISILSICALVNLGCRYVAMGGTTKKNPRPKPTKLTEFFNTSSQPPDPKRGLLFPSSPTPSSHPDLMDFEPPEESTSGATSELTLQKLFQSFCENLQTDFRRKISDRIYNHLLLVRNI